MLSKSAAYSFGQKLASVADAFDQYNQAFQDTYGTDIRLPHDHNALRSLLIASTVGAGLGLGRGAIWPGYIERKDKKGRIVAKDKRNPLLGALEGAALGAGASALSNYASQTMAQYNPELDQIMSRLPGLGSTAGL